MNTKKNKKAGFTLVELMVVAIIVAILAAVAIPLMSGNRDRAMATEAQAACGTISTQVRLAQIDGLDFTTTIDDYPGINDGDLNGNYYDHGDYSIEGDYSDYTITADANATKGGGEVTMTVNPPNQTEWTP